MLCWKYYMNINILINVSDFGMDSFASFLPQVLCKPPMKCDGLST